MKRLLILALVVMFVVPGTAFADDKLKVSGQYRMEMYTLQDDDLNSTLDDDKQYVDQRFRLQFDITPAENVKAVLRGDFAESNWGTVTVPYAAPATTSSGIGYRATANDSSTIMIDKAYVDLQTAMVNWKVGLFGHGGFGKALTTDNQGANVMVTADFAPITVTGLWTKVSEGTALTDDTLSATTKADEDEDIYGIQFAYKADAFGAGAFYAWDDNKVTDAKATVIGVYGDATFGMFSIWGEYDLYGGDNGAVGAAKRDYFGNNLTVQGKAALTDQFTLGLDVIWAAGSDDATEDQVPFLTDDSGYLPFDFGPFAAVTGESTGLGKGYEPFEANCGSKSFNLFATFAATEALTLYGNFGYVTPDVDDPNKDGAYYDKASVFGIAAKYTFLPGTAFSVKYRNLTPSGTTGLPDDAETFYAGMLQVNF